MHKRFKLGATFILFVGRVSAQEISAILPHVDAGGVVSWTATIDAVTVKTFVDAGGRGNRESTQTQALARWLDEHLAAVTWCKQGWRYRTENPEYIEELEDGRLRVLGICHAAQEQPAVGLVSRANTIVFADGNV